MKKRENILHFMITIIFILSLSCNKKNKIYKKPIENPIYSLNPKKCYLESDIMLCRNIYSTLLNSDGSGNIVSDLFKSWTIGDSGKSYIFEINQNAYFHDNKPITSNDLLFTFHYLSKKDSLVSSYLFNIKGYEEYQSGKSDKISGISNPSKYKIKIDLEQPSLVFLLQLSDPRIVLLPENLRGFDEDIFFQKPIGAGPYKVQQMNTERTHLILEKFPRFHGKISNIEAYDIKVYSKEDAKKEFILGHLDDLEDYTLNESDVNEVKKNANIFSTSSCSVNILLFNGRNKNMQDIDTRKSIAKAINYANYIKRDRIPTAGLMPYGLAGWTSKREIINNTPDKKNLPQKIKILTYDKIKDQDDMRKIKEDIESNFNINVEISYQTPENLSKIFASGDYDILFDWLTVNSSEPYNQLKFFNPISSHNLINFEDLWLTKKISNIVTMTPRQRLLAYEELSNHIVNIQQYAIPLYTKMHTYAYSKRVKQHFGHATFMANTSFDGVNF